MPALFDRKSGNCLILAMLMAFGLGTSCSDENLVNDIQGKEQLSFGVSISDKWNVGGTRSANDEETVSSTKIENSDLWLITTVEDNPDTSLFARPEGETRGKPYTPTDNDGNNDARLTDFGVYAYTYTGEWSSATDKKLYIGGDKVTPSGSVWSTESPRFWPGDAYDMKFFAYAPYSTGLYTENEGTITINDFSVNTDVNQQQDLLATIPMADAKGNYNQTLALTFKHILTAIDVKASDPLKRTITSISFSGIATKGKFTLNGEIPSWTPLESNVTEISCNVTEEDGVLDANEKYVISDENGTTFLMIPQKLDGAMIHVTFDNGDKLSASLSGKEWLIGKRVTYVISDSGIEGVIELNTEQIEFTYEGGIGQFNVKSYMESEGTRIAVPWTAKFVREDGTTINPKDSDYPHWLSNLTQSGNGSTDVAEYAFVESQQQLLSNSYNTWLQVRKIIGSDTEPHDLSMNEEGERYTANCYIVNNPGTYSFPLVYGNAIRKNNDDPSTYTSSSNISNTNVLGRFINHAGAGITSAWIAANEGCQPVFASLVWQDAKNLIAPESIELRGSTIQDYHIVFSVAKETIQEGNAVIAVYGGADGNTVLWSWHIWVTSYEQGLTPVTNTVYGPDGLQNEIKVVSANNIEYIFMGPPLGWCYGGEYPERTAKIRITQTDTSAEPKYIVVRQNRASIGNNATYYQWGRKDPILPSDGNDGNKTYYKSDGTSSKDLLSENGTGAQANDIIEKCIQNPGFFFITENGSMDNRYYNLWSAKERTGENADYDTETPDKSIYDPSPAGYEVPSNDATSGFTSGGVDLMKGGGNSYHNLMKNDDTYTDECYSPFRSPNEVKSNNGWVFYCQPNETDKGGVIYFPGLSCRSYGDGIVSRTYHGPDFSLNWSAYSYVKSGGQLTAHALWFEYNQIQRHLYGQNRGTACTVRSVKMRKTE